MDDDAGSRAIILHAHMFKNAGTTFDWSLQRSFNAGFLDHRDDDSMQRGADYLGPYLLHHPDLQALSSHWISFPLPRLDSVDIHLAMLFRHPLERIRSVYTFERQQQGTAPGNRQARDLGFLDYVRWRLQSGVGPVIRNYHTRCCSGRYKDEDIERQYELAIATVESTPLLGLVHRYDESMVLFEYHLQSAFPQIDLSWKLQNSSVGELACGTARRRAIETELESIMPQLIAANAYDLKLYAAVESRFEQALAAVPDFALRLQRMRSRGDALL
jgi:hypothetical protein